MVLSVGQIRHVQHASAHACSGIRLPMPMRPGVAHLHFLPKEFHPQVAQNQRSPLPGRPYCCQAALFDGIFNNNDNDIIDWSQSQWAAGQQVTSDQDYLCRDLKQQIHRLHSWCSQEDSFMDFTHCNPTKRYVFTTNMLQDVFQGDRQDLRNLQAYFEFQAEPLGMPCSSKDTTRAMLQTVDSIKDSYTSANDSSSSATARQENTASQTEDNNLHFSPAMHQLLKACILITGEPNLSPVIHRLEIMASHIKERIARTHRTDMKQVEVLRCMNAALYDFYRFRGAQGQRMYHPDCSNLLTVLQTKTGSPTAMGVIYMAIADALGFETAGISLPSHFLVRLHVDGKAVYVNPHDGGKPMSPQDIIQLLSHNLHLQTGQAPSTSASRGGELPSWLAAHMYPASTSAIVLRLLRNLRDSYWGPLQRRQVTSGQMSRHQQWHYSKSLQVFRFLRCLEPWHEGHAADMAMCMFLGPWNRREEAIELLDNYLQHNPHAREVSRALFWMESEECALQQVARLERESLQRIAREKKQRGRLDQLPDEKVSRLFGPDYFSRAYGRLWDDNYWISAILDNQAFGDDEDENKKKKK